MLINYWICIWFCTSQHWISNSKGLLILIQKYLMTQWCLLLMIIQLALINCDRACSSHSTQSWWIRWFYSYVWGYFWHLVHFYFVNGIFYVYFTIFTIFWVNCDEITVNSPINTKLFNNFDWWCGWTFMINIITMFYPIQKLIFNLFLFNQLFD